MGLEGSLLVGVVWDGHTVQEVDIGSSRPVEACRVFQGKPVRQALKQLPLLYTVCRTAQSVAATAACQQAGGLMPRASVRRLRHRLTLAETAQEYLWRFALDWPAAAGETMDTKAYVALRNRLAGLLQPMLLDAGWKTLDAAECESHGHAWEAYCAALAAYAEREIFGMPARTWSEIDGIDALRAWSGNTPAVMARVIGMLLREEASSSGGNAVALMPPAAELAQAGTLLAADEDFARRPHWCGQPLETGALARMQGHPLVRAALDDGRRVLARLLARLLELAALPQGIRATEGEGEAVAAKARGVGEAWVETARGLLLHRVEVEGEQVGRYQILAPTEWNFHPQGALARELAGLHAQDEVELRGKIARAMLALDPCVGYEVKVAQHA